MAEPTQYLERRAQQALAHDPRVQELDLRVRAVNGDEWVLVTGCVATSERRDAVTEVLEETLPGIAVVNEVEVMPLEGHAEEEEVDR